MAPSTSHEECTLTQLLGYFLRLGTFGFGGPIALAGRMDRDLVEERGWVSRQDYVEASRSLNCLLAHSPPNSQCTSVGYELDDSGPRLSRLRSSPPRF